MNKFRFVMAIFISSFIASSALAALCIEVSGQRPITFKVISIDQEERDYGSGYTEALIIKADLVRDEHIDIFPTNKQRPAPVIITVLTNPEFEAEPLYKVGETYTLRVSITRDGGYQTHRCVHKKEN